MQQCLITRVVSDVTGLQRQMTKAIFRMHIISLSTVPHTDMQASVTVTTDTTSVLFPSNGTRHKNFFSI